MTARGPVLDEVLDGAEVIVCCGSGGVGKTTTAAVIGLEAARRGRRAVVVTIDPARRLADALGLPDGLAAAPQAIALGEGPGELWAMMLDTASAFDDVVRRNAADEGQARRILGNPFYRNISGALSGTQEYMAAETLHLLHDDERFDLVVVDTPPSRNALDFLEAPGVLARFLDHRLFRLLMLPARTRFPSSPGRRSPPARPSSSTSPRRTPSCAPRCALVYETAASVWAGGVEGVEPTMAEEARIRARRGVGNGPCRQRRRHGIPRQAAAARCIPAVRCSVASATSTCSRSTSSSGGTR